MNEIGLFPGGSLRESPCKEHDMTTITRRNFMASAAAATLTVAMAGRAQAQAGPRPNLLILTSDDHRWNALGCMGNAVIKTPWLDRLAAQGVVFDNTFATTPICCSSRASMFTGLYTRTHGVVNFSQPCDAHLQPFTYPEILRQHGYYTGFAGKFGIGSEVPEGMFDVWHGYMGQGYYWPDGEHAPHMTERVRDSALNFLQTCRAGEPFCLSVSFKTPHVVDGDPHPWQPMPQYAEMYKDAEIPVPETATEEDYDSLPEFLKDTEGRKRWAVRFKTSEDYQKNMRDYYALITGMDAAIGRLVDELKNMGVYENTVIVYISDNGFVVGERGLAGKWYAYEPSIRIPLIIHDGRVAAKAAPKRAEAMALNIDLMPTLLELAGVPMPAWVEGQSLVPLTQGQPDFERDSWFFEHNFVHKAIPKSEGVRTEEWKYINWYEQTPEYEELFNLREDPNELDNLVDDPEHAVVLSEMRARLRGFRAKLPEGLPTER